MQLYLAQGTVGKTYRCNTLQLAPTATTVSLAKKRPSLDTRTCGNGFDLRDCANDIEFHSRILSENPCSGKASINHATERRAVSAHGAL